MSSEKQIVGKGFLTEDHAEELCLSEEKTMVFVIRDFERLDKWKKCDTTAISCHGCQWHLTVYPGGKENVSTLFVSLYLTMVGGGETKTEVKVAVGRNEGHTLEMTETFSSSPGAQSSWGWLEATYRNEVIEKLDDDGSLQIRVALRCWLKRKPIWRFENSLKKKVCKLYDCGESADVSFNLDGGGKVRAHKSVLSIQCPVLYDIVKDGETHPDRNGDIELDNTDGGLFAMLVRYMYHEALPSSFDLKKDGIELLKLANRFGYTDLKMHIEADLVGSNLLTTETAADYLLLADGISCALLKEAAMDIVVSNYTQMMKSNGWKSLKESSTLLAEIIELSQTPSREAGVSALRKRCADMGKEVDGTKEMLIKRCR